MSTPAGGNNAGILESAAQSLQNAGQYVSESVQSAISGAQKEGNKEQAKGNVPGKDSLTDRASGAFSAAGDMLDEKTHDASAAANKQSI